MKGPVLPISGTGLSLSAYTWFSRDLVSDLTLVAGLFAAWLTVCYLGWQIIAIRIRIRRLRKGYYDEDETD